MKHINAFTLAETLIILGLIGVVASLTVSDIVTNYQNNLRLSSLKKSYSLFSNALNIINREYGLYEDWGLSNDQNSVYLVAEKIEPFLKIAKKCINEVGCWSGTKTKNLKGNTDAYYSSEKGWGEKPLSYVLTDGSFLALDTWNTSVKSVFGVNSGVAWSTIFFVDTDGFKGPNKVGVDVFPFVLSDKGFLPAGADNETYCCKTNSSWCGLACTARVLRQNEVMK